MDPRCAPEPVGQTHLSDQTLDLNWNLWPTATRARLPAPVQSEAGPMPPNDRLRLDNGYGFRNSACIASVHGTPRGLRSRLDKPMLALANPQRGSFKPKEVVARGKIERTDGHVPRWRVGLQN